LATLFPMLLMLLLLLPPPHLAPILLIPSVMLLGTLLDVHLPVALDQRSLFDRGVLRAFVA